DRDLEPVEVDVLHLVDLGADQQAGAEEAERDRGGDDHRDGHGEIPPEPGQHLRVDEVRAHRVLSSQVGVGGPGQNWLAADVQRPAPYTPRLSSRFTRPSSNSTTRRRIESTMLLSWVAISTVVPVRLIRSSSIMMSALVSGSRFPVGSSASSTSGRL